MSVASTYHPEVLVDNSETPFQHEWGDASLPDSDPSNLSKSPPRSAALLGANSTLSMVLGTPSADLSSSLLSVGRTTTSRSYLGVPMRGTPSAVGAIHPWKLIPTPPYAVMPLQNSLLGLSPHEFREPTVEMSIIEKQLKVSTYSILLEPVNDCFNSQTWTLPLTPLIPNAKNLNTKRCF